MLIEQLRELCDYGMVSKTSYEGYPLKVEYALTSRGTKMLEAVVIMQGIGIEMMMEDGKEEFLRKGIAGLRGSSGQRLTPMVTKSSVIYQRASFMLECG